MSKAKEVVYLKHPVSAAEKTKHMKAGKKIIDIRFAPEGYGVEVKEEKPAPAAKAKPKAGK